MKVLNVIKKTIIGIVGVIYFSFVIVMTIFLLNRNKEYKVTQFDDLSLIIIKDEISNTKYEKGDLVLVRKKTLEKINVGDEIFAYKLGSDEKITIDVGIVGNVYPNDGTITFENGSGYSSKFIIGSAEKVYNKIGTYLSIVQSQWGFLFIILVPSFLIFVYEFYALVVEIKYGKANS